MDNNLSVVTWYSKATASAPVFTGNKINAKFTGQSSDINAEFTGTQNEIEVSGTYNQAVVKSVDFVGDSKTIKPELVKEDKTVTVS